MSGERASEILTHFGEILRHDMTIFLQGRAETEDIKHPLKVVGWIAGKFFLTTCPYENGVRLKLESGATYKVIYISGGRVYGFTAHLFREIQTMVPLLLFGYPDVVESVELRKEPRYTTFFAADIGSESSEILELFKGTVVNLSKSGCLVKLKQVTAWNVGEEVNMSFDMPTDNQQYDILCIIRCVKRSKDNETLGLEFLNVPEEFRNQVDVVASVAEEAL